MSVEFGHHHVADDEVGPQEAGPLQRLAPVLGHAHLQPLFFQVIHRHTEVGWHIIHDQDDLAISRIDTHHTTSAMWDSIRFRIALDWNSAASCRKRSANAA